MRRKITNTELNETIANLKRRGRQNKARVWLRVAEFLGKPKRSRIAVNVSRIARNTRKDDTVAIPGKVLAAGSIDHPVHIGAFRFSHTAKTKIEKAGGSCVTLSRLSEDHPEGNNVRILR